jgi:hypothetical protein
MKITEHISDRTEIEGVSTDVDIEVDQIGGSSSRALEVAERIENAVKDEIKKIADEDE